MCVISTPEASDIKQVFPVVPYTNAKFMFDAELCARSRYLPKSYLFSVKVYEDQFLHVKSDCVDGSCNCVYYLDGIQAKLKPCRVAASIYVSDIWSPNNVFVLDGVCRGFRIVDDNVNLKYRVQNYNSILKPEMYDKMCDNIYTEIYSGQISPSVFPADCMHALGAVERPDGRLRPITDCSKPILSVNDFMHTTAPRFKFSSIDDTRPLVSEKGYGCVTDISNAYRNVLIYPPNREYLGFSWKSGDKELYYKDNMLCFGLKSAPSIFNSITTFIVEYMHVMGYNLVGYLDDLFYAAPTREECYDGQQYLLWFLHYMGFTVNFNKLVAPSQDPKFLGIVIDLCKMSYVLPESKLQKTSEAVSAMLEKKWASYKSLERLAGLLAHCAALIKGGRTFCRRLYTVLKATKGKRRIHLSPVVKQDLRWWKAFLRIFNGSCPIRTNTTDRLEVYTDASGTGFGAWTSADYLFGFWDSPEEGCIHLCPPPSFTDLSTTNINVKELWPVVASIHRWGASWRHRVVKVYTDNTQVLNMILSGRSKNFQAMDLIREIFWCCALYNIDLEACYISTKENVFADKLSRIKLPIRTDHAFGMPVMFSFCCAGSITPGAERKM